MSGPAIEKPCFHLKIYGSGRTGGRVPCRGQDGDFCGVLWGGFLLAGFNFHGAGLRSELLLFELGKRLTLLHSVSAEGLVHSISAYRNRFVTSHGPQIVVYEVRESRICKVAETRSPSFPVSLCFGPDGRRIFVNDMMKPFCMFRYGKGELVQKEVPRALESRSIQISQVLRNRVFMADNQGNFFLYSHRNVGGAASLLEFYYAESITCTCSGYLGPGKKRCVYFATEYGSVGMVSVRRTFDSIEIERIGRLQEYCRSRQLFSGRPHAGVIDVDLFEEHDMDRACIDLHIEPQDARMLLGKIAGLF